MILKELLQPPTRERSAGRGGRGITGKTVTPSDLAALHYEISLSSPTIFWQGGPS